jgi:hypothetical protein
MSEERRASRSATRPLRGQGPLPLEAPAPWAPAPADDERTRPAGGASPRSLRAQGPLPLSREIEKEAK